MNLVSQEQLNRPVSMAGSSLSDGFVVPAVVSAVLWGVEVAVGKIT